MNIHKTITAYLSAKSMLKTEPRNDHDRRNYARAELRKAENELYLILDREHDPKNRRLIESILNN